MKHIVCLVLGVAAAIAAGAQCPGCTPSNCAAQNPDGGLCDTILIGMANHPMDEQISFYMPTQVYTTLLPGGGYVQLDRIQITGVVGLPLGLNWETNHAPSNEYYPQTGDSIGCVRVCGTPIQADTFSLIVYLLADVTAPVVGQVKNRSQTYNNAVVIILPDTSGGVTSFSIAPNIKSSCDPLTLTFEGKITSAANPVTYEWDFGNGNTGTGIMPGSQTYSAPGQYPVTLTTTLREYVIRRVRVIQVNSNWTGDIEELTSFLNSPDLFFTIPVLGYTSSEISNASTPATWSNLSIHIPIGTSQFELRIYDKDNGPPLGSQDDSLGSAIINVAAGTFLWTDRNGTVTNGDILIDDTVGSVITETLNIEIGEKPSVTLTATPGDSICGGDSTILALSGSGIFRFTWFKDSVFIPTAADTFLNVKTAGVYWAEVTSSSGCSVVSQTRQIRVFNYPPVPSVYFNAATNLLYTTNSSHVANIQWYRNGEPIAGATAYSLTVTDTGHYSVEYSNVLGCSAISAETFVSGITSADELPKLSVLLHPNPNNGLFELEFAQTNGDGFSIIITDFLGRIVFKENGAGNKTASVFHLSHLNSGTYFCRVLSGNSQTVEKMLIMK
ncbi:MAG TPA: T9SS type A sorting domain-containing protein [Chitinophagales bacterium]|nr:T9SS type A sorting domain-containing protein [Chitinophagales bacterium]